MMNLYYVVEKELHGIDDVEETTGNKRITGYDIDTQSMSLVIIFEIECENDNNSEVEISTYLENNGDEEDYNMIQL